jgi:succinate dehydrogenase / fumarate reductase flavoprotein subunit
MGGVWVDYNLESTIPGLFVIGEANFSDHGANRLGASALMQGVADGYFIISHSMGNYLARGKPKTVSTDHEAFKEAEAAVKERTNRLLSINGKHSASYFHRELGKIMWEYVGMERNEADLLKALEEIPKLRAKFWEDVRVPGESEDLNQALEYAGRVADFFEIGELMALDALHRAESCGGHFRVESQTDEGEALRDDENFSFVSAWEYQGEGKAPILNKEPLTFEYVKLSQRSYK